MTTEPRCDRVLEPGDDLQAILDEAVDGAVIGLPAGTWSSPGPVQRSVTLLGLGAAGEVILEGGKRGPVVAVECDGVQVRLVGLTLRGGFSETGGGVRLSGFSELRLEDCVVCDNKAGQGGGGGAHADAGELILERCRLRDNTAVRGNAVLIDGVAGAHLETCLVVGATTPAGAALRIGDGAEVKLHGSTLVAEGGGAAISVSGTSSRRPTVHVQGCLLSGQPAVDLDAAHAGRVHVGESLLSSPAAGVYKPVGKVLVDAPWFEHDGAEPYRPGRPSLAHGLVANGQAADLCGKARRPEGATAGAFE